MQYLYGISADQPRRLVATFSSPEQLRAYVRWATLEELGDRPAIRPQGSSLAGYDRWESSAEPLNSDDPSAVTHNPSPSML